MTHHRRSRLRTLLLLLPTALLLGACSGGADEDAASDAPEGSTLDPDAPAQPAMELEDSLFDLDQAKVTLTIPWRMGPMTRDGSEGEPSVVQHVELIRHAEQDFDRLTISLDPRTTALGYRLDFVDEPPARCGSGEAVAAAEGAGSWLTFALDNAQAHDAGGNPTLDARDMELPDGGNALGWLLTCDFEGRVELALPLREKSLVRIVEMKEPGRIVVEINH